MNTYEGLEDFEVGNAHSDRVVVVPETPPNGITKDQAMSLTYGTELHYGECTRVVGPRGGVTEHSERWRVNGKCRTWVTRPNEFTVPIKHGLYRSAYLMESNADKFHVAADCPLNKV